MNQNQSTWMRSENHHPPLVYRSIQMAFTMMAHPVNISSMLVHTSEPMGENLQLLTALPDTSQ
jgi:hypothetical protein